MQSPISVEWLPESPRTIDNSLQEKESWTELLYYGKGVGRVKAILRVPEGEIILELSRILSVPEFMQLMKSKK